MRKILSGLVMILLLFTLITLGCFEDSGDKKSNQAPNADAGSNIEVLSMTEIQFNGLNSTDPDGKIVSYAWDFDDHKNPGGSTSTDPEVRYTYNYPGLYEVTLTVTDDDGLSATDTITVKVNNRRPVVDIGGDITANINDIIYFNTTATDHDGYIRSYEWNFDSDGKNDWFAVTTGSTTHFYERPGTYQATLSVTDNSNDVTIVTKNITITEIIHFPPFADAGLDQTVPVGNVLLKGTGVDPDGNIELYEWDFDGDDVFEWNSTSTGIVTHIYNIEGKYTAKFRVTDNTGLIATDEVTIIVNNSYIAHNVTAFVYIDWTDSYDYCIEFNTTVNTSEIKIVITDINSKNEELFASTDLLEINATKFRLRSFIVPVPTHGLQVQVFYYQTLIGARVLDIINKSYDFVSPDLDFEAVFDYNQLLEEHNRGNAETITIESIGDMSIKKNGDLYYASLFGTGEYYIVNDVDGAETETRINCTELWINATYSGSRVVTQSVAIDGYGTMEATNDDGMIMYMDIKRMRLVTENNVQIENYMYGEGTFSGSVTDPGSGLDIESEGTVIFTSQMIGHGDHENWAGDDYSCTIMFTNVTLDGTTGLAGGMSKTQFQSILLNTTWDADYEKYSNNTIYYEYTLISTVANLETYDTGQGYPNNQPTLKEEGIHIEDAMFFNTPRPRMYMGEDSIVLRSDHGVLLRVTVSGEGSSIIIIDGKKYDCVNLHGDIIMGGEGVVSLRIIRTGDFTGITISSSQDLSWRDEKLVTEQVLKSINS